MPELDLNELRKIAEGVDGGAHIAAFDPPTVLALIERVEYAESEHKALQDEFWGIVAARNKALNRAEKAEREATELRAGRGKWKGTTDA